MTSHSQEVKTFLLVSRIGPFRTEEPASEANEGSSGSKQKRS